MQTRNKCWTHGCIVPGVVHTKLDPIRVRLNKDTLDSKKSNKQSLLSVTSPASSFYPPKMYSNTNIFNSLLLIIFLTKKISLCIIFLYIYIYNNPTKFNWVQLPHSVSHSFYLDLSWDPTKHQWLLLLFLLHKLRQRVRTRPRPSLRQRNLLVSVSSEADSTILRMAKVVIRFSTILFRILLQNPTKKSVFIAYFFIFWFDPNVM